MLSLQLLFLLVALVSDMACFTSLHALLLYTLKL
jgi:hypothetical protein